MRALRIGDKVETNIMRGSVQYKVVGNITDMTNTWCVLNNDYVVWKDNCNLIEEETK